MGESLASITWQETVDKAVTRLEEKTGLALVGLSQLEISLQVREWMRSCEYDIGLLDTLDPDPDIEIDADIENDTADDEPLHGAPEQQAGSWKGIDAVLGCGDGEELELGWTELEARFGRYRAAGENVYEPSLGSSEGINQLKWSKGSTDDGEAEHDGREPDSDNEPDWDGEGTGNYVGACSPCETMFQRKENDNGN